MQPVDLGEDDDDEATDLAESVGLAQQLDLPEPVEHLTFRHDLIDHEYAIIGPRLASQGELVARLTRAYSLARARRKEVEAQLALTIRASAKVTATRITERELNDTLYGVDPYASQLRVAYRDEVDAEACMDKARTDLEAIRIEGQMLIQAGSDRRKEMGLDNLTTKGQPIWIPPAPKQTTTEEDDD